MIKSLTTFRQGAYTHQEGKPELMERKLLLSIRQANENKSCRPVENFYKAYI
jgi:hypothetical protein